MIKRGIPLTRENYIAFNYPGMSPDDIGPELENEMPPGMRLDDHGNDPTARSK